MLRTRIESFRLENEYDFRISNQSCSQICRFSLLLISKGEGSRNNIGVLCDDLEYALWVSISYSYSNLKVMSHES